MNTNDKEQLYSQYKELVLEAYPETSSDFGSMQGDRDLDNIKTKIDRLYELLPDQKDLIGALWADIQSALE